ncbi:MAG: alpha-hydroxy acid oxidase [Nocardioides sp.]|uniref:alpha-hydroxy acid oxidase n=1 Tax=Nocardioides sp. TaxID=35761 RepID=UPI0039E4D566
MRRSRALEFESYPELLANAKKVLPPVLFKDMVYGYGKGVTARRNEAVFDQVELVPRAAVGWDSRDLTTTVLGAEVSMPVLVPPVGGLRLVHPEGAPGVAAAAGRAKTIAGLSMMAGHTLDDVADRATGPMWQQVFLSWGRELVSNLVSDARRRGFHALVATVDCPIWPKKPVGLKVSLSSALEYGPDLVRRPRWATRFFRDGTAMAAVNAVMGPRQKQATVWSDMAWLKEIWGGPLVIKGILGPADARRAVEAGADAIIVSNHGGLALDGTPATLTVLSSIVKEVGGEVEVLFDGGVRQGIDVVRALALGARAVLVGRPSMLGLAVGGADGVEVVLEKLRHEVDVALAMIGAPSAAAVDSSFVRPPSSWS